MKQLAWFCMMTVPLTVSLTILDGAFNRVFANPPALTTGIPAAANAPPLQVPRPGLWQEISTTVDGVTVRKIRDTTGGDYNVCYIASRQVVPNPYDLTAAPAMLAISCVPEKRP